MMRLLKRIAAWFRPREDLRIVRTFEPSAKQLFELALAHERYAAAAYRDAIRRVL